MAKAKRGRKRDIAIRTPSGQKSRSAEALGLNERLTLEAATWKRRQENPGLTISEARKPQYGSVILKWLAEWQAIRRRDPDRAHINMFTQMHYDTAERYHALYLRWMAAINAKGQRSSTDFSGPGGYDGADPFDDARAERDAKVENDFKDARRAVLESGPLGMMAMETIVIENQPVESLRGDLREALNRLAILWKMMERAA